MEAAAGDGMAEIYESIQCDQWLSAQQPEPLITTLSPALSPAGCWGGFKKQGVENGKQDTNSKGRRKTEARALLIKAAQEIAKLNPMCTVLDHMEVLL